MKYCHAVDDDKDNADVDYDKNKHIECVVFVGSSRIQYLFFHICFLNLDKSFKIELKKIYRIISLHLIKI